MAMHESRVTRRPLVVYTSEHGHMSIEKAASIIGVVLFDFGTSSGMLDPDEDENDRMCHAQIHDWQKSGF